jgi:hypothetical protein
LSGRRHPELDPEAVRPDDFEGFDLVNRMSHALYFLSERLDLARRLACLQSAPRDEQLRLMNFGPRFDEPALPLGYRSPHTATLRF